MESNYQICKRCVMDTSDPEILFDENGICNHCKGADELAKILWQPNSQGLSNLNKILNEIKDKNKKKNYDCILGLSGGVDSSYLAHLASKEWGLRILAVHVNAGWNSEIAEANIERIVNNNRNIDLYTYVVDWEEVRDLQLAYFKSGISNQDVPQDHVFFAQLYKTAAKEKIQFILTGTNFATESIMPSSWVYDALDGRNLRAIHSKFGSVALKSYTTLSFFERYVYYPFILKQKIVRPLNYLEYDKANAKKFLMDTYKWKDYGVKHGESVFTKFFQNYWLPERFGFDKRKGHLSSMIVSGYITRENALEELQVPLYDSQELQRDKEYICQKLEISLLELENIFNAPKVNFNEYDNYLKYGKMLRGLKKAFNFKVFR